jgi:hypothetical protein
VTDGSAVRVDQELTSTEAERPETLRRWSPARGRIPTPTENDGPSTAVPLRTAPVGRGIIAIHPAHEVQAAERFDLRQQFEGTVLTAGPEEFTARLHDRTTPGNPDEIATFLVAEVSDSDRSLLVPGAVFYWSMGYRIWSHGQRERASRLQFRRMPAWSRGELAAASAEADHWLALFDEPG